MTHVDRVLDAIVRAAVDASGASRGWLLERRKTALRVVAAAGGDRPGEVLGAEVPLDSGVAGWVVSSGRPMAIAPRETDRRLEEFGALTEQRPASVLCVPCNDEEPVGALEVIDKAGRDTFDVDDVEIVTLLARVAGAALAAGTALAVPQPSELTARLERLAADDPPRYAAVAGVVAALLT